MLTKRTFFETPLCTCVICFPSNLSASLISKVQATHSHLICTVPVICPEQNSTHTTTIYVVLLGRDLQAKVPINQPGVSVPQPIHRSLNSGADLQFPKQSRKFKTSLTITEQVRSYFNKSTVRIGLAHIFPVSFLCEDQQKNLIAMQAEMLEVGQGKSEVWPLEA